MTHHSPTVSGDLVSQDAEFSLEELCRTCTVSIEYVIELVQEGVLEPHVELQEELHRFPPEAWRFRFTNIRRARTAMRLQRDLGVNLAGAALALDLLDRIEELQRQQR